MVTYGVKFLISFGLYCASTADIMMLLKVSKSAIACTWRAGWKAMKIVAKVCLADDKAYSYIV